MKTISGIKLGLSILPMEIKHSENGIISILPRSRGVRVQEQNKK